MTALTQEYNATSGTQLDVEQIKNKLKHLKVKWALWVKDQTLTGNDLDSKRSEPALLDVMQHGWAGRPGLSNESLLTSDTPKRPIVIVDEFNPATPTPKKQKLDQAAVLGNSLERGVTMMSEGLVKAAMQLSTNGADMAKLDRLINSTEKQTESLNRLIELLSKREN